MSNSRDAAAASGGGRNSPPDTQALIGLLENLVPLLLHFQTQSFGPSGSGRLAGGHGAQLEQQAAVTFTEDIILDVVRNLSGYLQKNANRYPGLEAYAAVVADAKRALAARDYQAALALVFETYRAITILRAIRSELPPIRQRSSDEQADGDAGGDRVH